LTEDSLFHMLTYTGQLSRYNCINQEQQRVAVGPRNAHVIIVFTKCRPMQPRCSAAGLGTDVWRRCCCCRCCCV